MRTPAHATKLPSWTAAPRVILAGSGARRGACSRAIAIPFARSTVGSQAPVVRTSASPSHRSTTEISGDAGRHPRPRGPPRISLPRRGRHDQHAPIAAAAPTPRDHPTPRRASRGAPTAADWRFFPADLPAAVATARRRRAVLHRQLRYATGRGGLTSPAASRDERAAWCTRGLTTSGLRWLASPHHRGGHDMAPQELRSDGTSGAVRGCADWWCGACRSRCMALEEAPEAGRVAACVGLVRTVRERRLRQMSPNP